MHFRKSRYLMWIGFAVGFLIMAAGIAIEDEKLIGGFMAVGAIIFFSALIQAYIFYKCPDCGHSFMNIRGEIPEFCPKCGKELNEK